MVSICLPSLQSDGCAGGIALNDDNEELQNFSFVNRELASYPRLSQIPHNLFKNSDVSMDKFSFSIPTPMDLHDLL
jgi:hypothetical protein